MKEPPLLPRSERLSQPGRMPAAAGMVTRALLRLVSRIPAPTETPNAHPSARARAIAQRSARRAATISGALSLPPGPIGLSTVLPDLYAIWRVQQKMVADIAACYGQDAFLTRETMVYCLFKHGSAVVLRDLVVRTGERVIVHRATQAGLRRVLEKIGVRVTERVLEKSVSRWIPIIGAVGMGAFAYRDTMKVATDAIDLFSQELRLESQTSPPPLRAG